MFRKIWMFHFKIILTFQYNWGWGWFSPNSNNNQSCRICIQGSKLMDRATWSISHLCFEGESAQKWCCQNPRKILLQMWRYDGGYKGVKNTIKIIFNEKPRNKITDDLLRKIPSIWALTIIIIFLEGVDLYFLLRGHLQTMWTWQGEGFFPKCPYYYIRPIK